MPDKVIKFEGCGHPLPPVVPYVPDDSTNFVYDPKVVIDEKSLEPVVKVSQRNLDEEIQSYKDECGIAFVLRQIAAGRLSVNEIRDDGQSGHDILGNPETMNESFMAVDAATGAAAAEASKLGINLSEEALQKFIQAEIVKANAAKASTGSDNGGDK